MERDYFDARFQGLEKLIENQQENIKDYIGAVSSNVRRVEQDLAEHRESVEAHGRRATDRFSSNIVSWAGLVIAAIVGLFELKRNQ